MKLSAITGAYTFSSNLPWEEAMEMTDWLPCTRQATMVRASHWVGLTLPGMMEEPGSLAGIVNSPRPALGPPARRRISSANFMQSPPSASRAPWVKTMSSRPVKA